MNYLQPSNKCNFEVGDYVLYELANANKYILHILHPGPLLSTEESATQVWSCINDNREWYRYDAVINIENKYINYYGKLYTNEAHIILLNLQ